MTEAGADGGQRRDGESSSASRVERPDRLERELRRMAILHRRSLRRARRGPPLR